MKYDDMIFGAIYEYPYQPLIDSLYGWGSGYVFIHNTFILKINNTSYSINSITQNCILIIAGIVYFSNLAVVKIIDILKLK